MVATKTCFIVVGLSKPSYIKTHYKHSRDAQNGYGKQFSNSSSSWVTEWIGAEEMLLSKIWFSLQTHIWAITPQCINEQWFDK